MTKPRIVETESMIKGWRVCVDEVLFPPRMVELLTPEKILDRHVTNLSALSKEYKDRVDMLIGEIRSLSEGVPADRLLIEADPMVVAMYYYRLKMSEALLQALLQDSKTQVLNRTDDLISFLLFHERLQ